MNYLFRSKFHPHGLQTFHILQQIDGHCGTVCSGDGARSTIGALTEQIRDPDRGRVTIDIVETKLLFPGLLDDIFSSVDAECENGGVTIVAVAHSSRTIKKATVT